MNQLYTLLFIAFFLVCLYFAGKAEKKKWAKKEQKQPDKSELSSKVRYDTTERLEWEMIDSDQQALM